MAGGIKKLFATPQCPECSSTATIRNGLYTDKRQKYLCRACKKNWIADALEIEDTGAIAELSELTVVIDNDDPWVTNQRSPDRSQPQDSQPDSQTDSNQLETSDRSISKSEIESLINQAIERRERNKDLTYVPTMPLGVQEKFEGMISYNPFEIMVGNFYALQAQMAAAIDGSGDPLGTDEKKVLGMMQVMLEEEAISGAGYERIRLKLMDLNPVQQASFHNQCTGIVARAMSLRREGDTFKANQILKNAMLEMAAVGNKRVQRIALNAIQLLKLDAGLDTDKIDAMLRRVDNAIGVNSEEID